MAIVAKFFTIALALNLVQSSLQSHFIQDDILAFPRYKVVVTREKVSNTDVSLKHAESSSNTIMMTSSLGQPFSCIIPDVQVEQERLEREKEESTQEETEQDVNKIIEKGLELLEPIGSNCIRFFTSTHQYWAYEYCHNQYVRQFHVERSHDGKVEKEQETASFFLGLYPGLSKESLVNAEKKAVAATTKKEHARVKTELKKNGDQRYLVQKWGDGSRCDLTEKPRTIEVQYHCDLQGQDRVSSFVELSTCNYQIIISTPRLCEDMNLSHRHHIEPHKIKCRPVVSDQLIEQEQQEREREKEDINSDENQPLAEAEYQPPQTNEKEASGKELPQTDKALLEMISDLTEQINQLKLQMNAIPADTAHIRPDFSFFTLDDQGNVIPGADLAKLFATAKQQQQPQKQHITVNTEKKQPAKDQHENKQAYQQKYIAA
ncbi:glucosidase II beta subunit-like protein [Mucor ambiguus]|uniref:Protein OS-9 homolog n=1 Tax=Mucor ambiguus TaxID=91626 RepID=A0A0C9MS12_9FUNG|nr:glucosidase II beta subunit-like protein [Mucor ambiguus]